MLLQPPTPPLSSDGLVLAVTLKGFQKIGLVWSEHPQVVATSKHTLVSSACYSSLQPPLSGDGPVLAVTPKGLQKLGLL